MSDFVGNGSSCICFGGSEGLWAPLEQKLRGTKEWDGDMVAWTIVGIRVLILDTQKTVCTYTCLNPRKFESCYFHAIYLVYVNQFLSRNWNSMDFYQCTIIVWLIVIYMQVAVVCNKIKTVEKAIYSLFSLIFPKEWKWEKSVQMKSVYSWWGQQLVRSKWNLG